MLRSLFAIVALLGLALGSGRGEPKSYSDIVLADEPVLYLSFDGDRIEPAVGKFRVRKVGNVTTKAGAIPPEWSLFDKANRAGHFDGRNANLRITDPGPGSPLDFDSGDSMALEAWVSLDRAPASSYIVGKGRTHNKGFDKDNQNWSMRLMPKQGAGALSFLFRSQGKGSDYHRWTSNDLVGAGDGWHHLVICYRFGDAKSLRAYIDGQSVKGKWDIGGATARAPVVDDDEVWVGSAMGGQPNSTFPGLIDELAVYRRILTEDRIRARYRYSVPPPVAVEVPKNKVLVQILEGVPSSPSWAIRRARVTEVFELDTLALPELPKRYSKRAIHIDRPRPFLVRAYADVVNPKGEQRLLICGRDAARLFLDGKEVVRTAFNQQNEDSTFPVKDLDRSHAPNIRPLQRGDSRAVVSVTGDGRTHRLRFETFVGRKGRRPEIGEASVSIGPPKGDFTLIGFGERYPLTEDGWLTFVTVYREKLAAMNKTRRTTAGKEEAEYWKRRHTLARRAAGEPKPGSIDSFLEAKLRRARRKPMPTVDDLTFLRRLTLDTIGTIPTREHVRRFLNDPRETRRKLTVERMLADPGWADHWMGYWQDVLAENPHIVNPALNNTGPFRWWMHESFRDNKPFDRFVTELVRMEGSAYFGGPAGFGLASENDVPMAAKAHILGQAFLGVQMQCARCHDAPFHDVTQKDVFSLAAMLQRGVVQVPKTSSVVAPARELDALAVKVTLKPGSKVSPGWTFGTLAKDTLPEGVVRDAKDSREKLAALLTSPENKRFARVVVNRLWKRYMGLGLVEPVHDWEGQSPSHPELLDWLGRELVANGYDLKHVARLILNSKAYQRVAVGAPLGEGPYLFEGPRERRLEAEQMVDSLFVVAGKPFDSGAIVIDVDGARRPTLSLNLGVPQRAWMFTTVSNERDRPSLGLPFAQPFVTFMEQFGWRGARQNPIHERPNDLTALQPSEFANGLLVRRVTRLSDDHSLTELALRADLTVSELVDELYLRMLTRKPTDRERNAVEAVLAEGFGDRRRPDEPVTRRPRGRRGMVSWSNHQVKEASAVKLALEEVVRRGDPPTKRLAPEWRERLEDVVWCMLNTPEFRFAP